VQSPENQLIYPGMGRRFLAFVADCVVLVVLSFVIGAILFLSGRRDLSENLVVDLAFILWLIYIVLALYFAHTTIGKYLFNIEVRSSRPDRAYPRISDLAMRDTVFRWISLILLTGYMPAFFDRCHRASTDRWANTLVVRRTGKPSRVITGIFVFITVSLLVLIALAFINRPK